MITNISIDHLRGIAHAAVANLTPISILVGPNGCGKSTVLDALLIAAAPDIGEAGVRALCRRTGSGRSLRWVFWRGDGRIPLKISASTSSGSHREISGRFLSPSRLEFNVSSNLPRSNSDMVNIHLHSDGSNDTYIGTTPVFDVPVTRLVESHSVDRRTKLHTLYSRSVEAGRRDEAYDAVRTLIPSAIATEILTDGDTPVMHAVFPEYSIPISSVGDGVQMTLRLGLELIAPPNSVVMLEEPETHLHPAAIAHCARLIFAAARKQVQVILTTHSLEFIDAILSEAKSDDELKLVSVIRMRLDDGQLKVQNIPGLEVAEARSGIEEDLR